MSEKHLTEAPWKALVSKQGIKDIGLQKVLAAYDRIDATNYPFRALEMLDQVSELALKLRKICSAKTEVVDHLNEVLKEIKKVMPGLEALAKKSPDASKAAER